MPPSIFLSLVMVSISSVLFHLFLGERLTELALFWLLGLFGFWLGQLLALLLHTRFLMIGTFHPVEGLVGCWLFLFLAKWLKV